MGIEDPFLVFIRWIIDSLSPPRPDRKRRRDVLADDARKGGRR